MLTYLGLGSNIEPRLEYLDHAVTALESVGQITQLSPIYETEPLGPGKQAWHLNQVVALETRLEPIDLLHSCKQIELALGRKLREHLGSREIDIDILLYNSTVVNTPELVIPHLELPNRRFMLQPLHDIAPDIAGPMLTACTDNLQVKLYEPS